MNQKNAGFTIIEVIIVLALTVIIGVMSGSFYTNFQKTIQLNEYTTQIIQYVRLAQSRSFAGKNNSAHGILISIDPNADDELILYQGNTYGTRNQSFDQVISLPSSITLQGTDFNFLGDDIDINFSRGTGRGNNSGNITVSHVATGSKQIHINSLGTVNLSDYGTGN